MNSFSSFKELYHTEFKENIFERWKIFLHLLSPNKPKPHDKFKILSLPKITENKLHFHLVTTDKFNAKEGRIKKGEAIIIKKGAIKCLSSKSIIDSNEIDEMSPSQVSELLKKPKNKYKKEEIICFKRNWRAESLQI